MKIVLNRQEISDAVAPLMCAIAGKSTLPAIEGILIEAKEDQSCVMTTFDLEKGMRITVPAEVEEPGSAVIGAQKFAQTLRLMEGEKVVLSVSDNLQVCITCGKSNHRMVAIAANDYPVIPRLVTEEGFVIGQSVLKRMISKVMYAMALSDQRPVLNGCFFRVSEGELLAVSCDGSRLSKCSFSTDIENRNDNNEELKFSFIVPNKTVGELYKLLKDDERETVRIYMSRKNIVFNIGEMTFFSRLIEGQYIDYDRYIVTTHRVFATLSRDAFISALERAALVTEEKIVGDTTPHVKLNFKEDMLCISADSRYGSTYDEIEIQHEGEDLLIAFKNRFLMESLKACTAEKVKLSMSTAFTSVNIEPVDGGDDVKELFMIMPVRMKE